MKNAIILILLISITSCSQTKDYKNKIMNSSNKIYWVNSSKADCMGVAPMRCLQIQKNENINPQQWEFFYSEIEGFSYQEGFLYQIEVKEEKIPENEVPADASSIKYSLVKIISKTDEKSNRIAHTWALESIVGTPIALGKSKRPILKFDLKNMRFTGTDGCNRIFGQIKKVNVSTLKLGPVAGTKMACEDMSIADDFHEQLKNVSTYVINDLTLSLLDENGIEVLSFAKTA